MSLCMMTTIASKRNSKPGLGTPNSFVFISSTATSITFSFSQTGIPTSYTATIITDDGNSTAVTGFGTTGTNTSYQINSLPTGNMGYRIKLVANDASGSSPQSAYFNAVTAPNPTTITSITVPSATDGTHPGNNWLLLNHTFSSSNCITGAGTILNYKINNTTNTTDSGTLTYTALTSSYYYGSLASNINHSFTITTYFKFTSASTATVTNQNVIWSAASKWTLPDAPTITSVLNNGPNSMYVNFNIVSGTTGYPNYTFYYGFANGNTNTASPDSAPRKLASPVDVYNLSAGTYSSFTVAAKNVSGFSAFSNTAVGTTNGSYTGGFNQLMYFYNFEQSSTSISSNLNSNTVTGNSGWTPNRDVVGVPGTFSLSTTSARGSYSVYKVAGQPMTIYSYLIRSSTGFSVCFWININVNPGGNSRFMNIYINGGTMTDFNGNGNSSNYAMNNFSYSFTYATWYHLAIVLDGPGNSITTYVNGVFNKQTDVGVFGSFNYNTDTNNLQICLGGTGPSDTGDSMNNTYYDEVQGYNMRLNQSHINYIYNNTNVWVGFD